MATTKKSTQDNRSLTKLAKDIETLRRKVQRAVKRHQKLQERIQRLQAEGRIIYMNKDAEVVHGDREMYVKSDSLGDGWYYVVKANECGCESHESICKHVRRMVAEREDKSYEEAVAALPTAPAVVVRGTLNYANQGFSLMR